MQLYCYLILLFYLVMPSACTNHPKDYTTALASCKPLHFGVINGKPDIQLPNTDCIIGASLPKFGGIAVDGNVIDENYFKGKVTVLNFWFVGCQGCEKEMPGLNQVVEKYKSSHVNFLAIGRNNAQEIRDFLMQRSFNFTQLPNGTPIVDNVFKLKWGYPFTIVADQHQKIIFTSLGMTDQKMHDELEPAIDKALKG
ncbi:MAG: TlpA family protein disulfide reductase [Saprospiraceae bacterium]|uniref:TlpA family protein disulfide reductase n=1 Tax=Candidatus Opimibacter skivensis TaxID=2982028 RepID=A0A9D7XNS1_9BACT|nr:TlpA family protein disulfide reductase [Candidatus Opimibacter skivensis]